MEWYQFLEIAALVLLVAWAVSRPYREDRLRVPDRARRRLARARKRRLARKQWPITGRLGVMIAAQLAFFVSHVADDHTSGRVQLMARVCFVVAASILVVSAVLVVYTVHRIEGRLACFLDEAERDEYRICLECYYPLRGLGDAGRCPECGASFTHGQLVQDWGDMRSVRPGRCRPKPG
jgi:hypothetical protein